MISPFTTRYNPNIQEIENPKPWKNVTIELMLEVILLYSIFLFFKLLFISLNDFIVSSSVTYDFITLKPQKLSFICFESLASSSFFSYSNSWAFEFCLNIKYINIGNVINTDIVSDKLTYFIAKIKPKSVYDISLTSSIAPWLIIDQIYVMSFIMYETNFPLSVLSKNSIFAFSNFSNISFNIPCFTFLLVGNRTLLYI